MALNSEMIRANRREVRVRLLERREDRLDEVPARLRVPAGAREAIGDAGEGQHLLRRGGADDAGTSLDLSVSVSKNVKTLSILLSTISF